MKQKTIKPPLFRITKEVWETIDPHTLTDTMNAMMDVDLWHPPYAHFVVETPALMGGDVWETTWFKTPSSDKNREYLKDKMWRIEYTCNEDEEYLIQNFGRCYEYVGEMMCPPHGNVPFEFLSRRAENAEYLDHIAEFIFGGLIILLATKNAEKKTIENDARSRTHRVREDAKKYATTTTIKIGAITETLTSGTGSGRIVRPHLRRGHVRQQRFGEGLEQVKKVFIAPCFVNADKDWVDINKNYKVVA